MRGSGELNLIKKYWRYKKKKSIEWKRTKLLDFTYLLINSYLSVSMKVFNIKKNWFCGYFILDYQFNFQYEMSTNLSLCGNGLLDPGEECDCGGGCINYCCFCCENCRLKGNAQCASGPCCNTRYCLVCTSSNSLIFR